MSGLFRPEASRRSRLSSPPGPPATGHFAVLSSWVFFCGFLYREDIFSERGHSVRQALSMMCCLHCGSDFSIQVSTALHEGTRTRNSRDDVVYDPLKDTVRGLRIYETLSPKQQARNLKPFALVPEAPKHKPHVQALNP